MICLEFLQRRFSYQTHSFNETDTISGVRHGMSFVGIFRFIVAETQCNRPAYPFPEERSLAHFAMVFQSKESRSVELIMRTTAIYLC